MEQWQQIALAEVNDLHYLLNEDPSFTISDLRDRLRGLLEYIELEPDKDPTNEDCESMTQEDLRQSLIEKLSTACTVLELERLRQLAKFAHQQMMNQARATAMQAQLDPFFATDDTPTAADPGDGIGAEPNCVVYTPGRE